MGFKFSYSATDLATAARVINQVSYDACNPLNDGFIAFGAKQDLHRLKWIIEDALKRSPDFGVTEADWLREQEKRKVVKILSNDDT